MVGIDTATSVYGNGCQEPFPVAGKREKLTVWPGPEQFLSVDRQKITRFFRDK
jgi:hypothetical protein